MPNLYNLTLKLKVSKYLSLSFLCLGFAIAYTHASANPKLLKSNTHITIKQFEFEQIRAQNINLLMRNFNPHIGIWQDNQCITHNACVGYTGWWYWAIASSILAQYVIDNPRLRAKYIPIFELIYTKNKYRTTHAYNLDDEGWWGLAFLKMYQATNRRQYLLQAQLIADNLWHEGRQSVCRGNGGIFWDRPKTQVGAIANELFISLSSEIATLNKHKRNKYTYYALSTWQWLKRSGLLSDNGLILDHYNISKNKHGQLICSNLVSDTYTYTNGVLFMGLVNLAYLTHNRSYIEQANKTATAAISKFVTHTQLDIIEGNNDPNQLAEDGLIFKGIFINNLALLAIHTQDKQLQGIIRKIIEQNTHELIKDQASKPKNKFFGYFWQQPWSTNNPSDIITHLSSLYLLNAYSIIKH